MPDNSAVNISNNNTHFPRGDNDPRIAQRLAIIVFSSLAFLMLVRLGMAGRVMA